MQSERKVLTIVIVAAFALAFVAGVLLGPEILGRAGSASSGAGESAGWRFQNPLLGAQPGEWTVHRVMNGVMMRLEILSVHPLTHAVTLRDERRDPKNDKIVGSSVLEVGTNHFLFGFESAGGVVTSVYPDEITVAGRSWRCLCVETSSPTMGPVRSWYSPEVPTTGLLKQERGGGGPHAVTAELISFKKD